MSGIVMQGSGNLPLLDTVKICEPKCIRLDIPSRTKSWEGACFHAGELVVKHLLAGAHSPRNYAIFVAGIKDGIFVPRAEEGFSCVRCASQFVLHQFHGVYTYDGLYWHFQSSIDALNSAKRYASGELEI
jgi:hypothetical protein